MPKLWACPRFERPPHSTVRLKTASFVLSSIYGKQIRDHLASYGQRRSIGIPFLLFCLIQ